MSIPRLGLGALMCGLVAAACASNPAQPTALPLGEPFDLRAGASSALQGGLRITFDRVTSDSRCPIDVLCVWGGDAIVVLTLLQNSGNRAERELHTDRRASEVSYLSYRIELVALAPARRSDRQIASGDYVATLSVKAP